MKKLVLSVLAFCLKLDPVIAGNLSLGIIEKEMELSHPLLQDSASKRNLLTSFTLLPLISMESNWKWQCRLCTSLPTLENKGLEIFTDKTGIQKLAIHLKLLNGIYWGDGQEMTMKDIAFTWKVIKKIPIETRTANGLQEIEDIIIHPQATRHFTILLKNLSSPYPILHSFYVLSSHMEKDLIKDQEPEASYFSNSHYLTNVTQAGLYNGAFIPTELKLGQRKVSFHRNMKAHISAPYEKIDVEIYLKPGDLLQDLNNKKVEMGLSINVWDETFSFIRSYKNPDKILQHSDSYFYEHLDFNLQNPFFQDRRVRMALAHAIDKEVILEKITESWTVPAVSPIHPGDPYFSPKVSLYDYSPSKASELLSQSDWALDSHGELVKKNRTLSFELLTIDDPMRIKTAQYLVEAWRKIGARVSIKTLPLQEFRERLSRRYFSGVVLYAWHFPLFQNTKVLYQSNSIPSLNNTYAGQNVSGWINTRVDETLTRFSNSADEEERKEYMEFFQQQYTHELPGIPLFFRTDLNVIPKHLTGLKISPCPQDLGFSFY